MTAFLIWLAIMGLLRLSELWLSAANRRSLGPQATVTEERIYPWMICLHGSFFLIQPLELWWRQPNFGGWVSWTAVTLVVLAELLRAWVLASMRRSWNVQVVTSPDHDIVTDGPYRWLRHPNYTVVILEMVAVPLIMHLWVSALFLSLVNGVVLYFRIRTEEAVLRQNPVWQAAMAHKPRFIPRLW